MTVGLSSEKTDGGVSGVTNNLIARVAVSAATYSIDKLYDYRIPTHLRETITQGMRVVVPFGRGNKRSEGIVLALSEKSEYDRLKCIESAMDSEPVLSDELIKLALWMRSRFFCTVYDAVHAMLPAGMWYKEGEKTIGDKTVQYASLAITAEEALIIADQKRLKAPLQSAALRLLAEMQPASIRDIAAFAGASSTVVRNLEKAGLVKTEQVEVFRRPEYSQITEGGRISLNAEQKDCFKGLLKLLNSAEAKAALLFGITGSGKTAVYIKLIQKAHKAGKSAIVLVPEIALTPQFLSIFSAHFGDNVAVLHSSLTTGERYDEWKRIRSGSVSLVIGTRSAVFAPVKNLGLIIIDEEQEYTYKSENAPRYHARDIAKYRCVQSNALLLLGSATPSIESMYSADADKYELFTLNRRYNEKDLPDVIIADMRRELQNGNGTSISSVLYRELKKNIDAGEQSILFINRRGAASLIVCGECGYTFSCPNCSVSMTHHSRTERIMCHYCGYQLREPEECPDCGGKLNFIGTGTQKVEEELNELFPDAAVIRMDTDTVSQTNSHDKILSTFREKNIPILVGTQMVTKGLNFENVTLVGVISADQMLYINDYRAHERTFSLITQVVGRSGRGSKAGRAVIQTFTPENDVILFAAKQDYLGFYAREVELRKTLVAPPVADIFTITVSGIDETAVLRGCVKLRDSLSKYLVESASLRVLGPAPANIVRVNNRFRYRISVVCHSDKRIRETIAHLVREFLNDKQNRGLSAFADINPFE